MRPHHAFWPSRLPRSITVPATSLWDNLAVNARRYPDKPALVFLGQEVSYSALHDGAERLAARLQALGVRNGCWRISRSCAPMPSSCRSIL
jgi:fatty-acyl-CoA synthase